MVNIFEYQFTIKNPNGQCMVLEWVPQFFFQRKSSKAS